MSAKASINGEVLKWAINRSQLPLDAIAQKMIKSEDVIQEWEDGVSKPTFNQAQKLAEQLRIPFGYLFLPFPPVEVVEIPDLRTIGDSSVTDPSPELRDIIKQALVKQEWYKEYLLDQDWEPIAFVGSLTINDDVMVAAEKIRSQLGVNLPETGTYQKYFSSLIEAIESVGVLVMRAGIVGNHTRRKLSVDEFRGFAISDSIAPAIFINSSDSPSARLFTLLHELVHIWIDSSGISGVSTHEEKAEEFFCNQVAAEFLAPKAIFDSEWSTQISIGDNIEKLSSRLHISAVATARKALTEKKITDREYWNIHNSEKAKFTKSNSESSGGNFYSSAIVKNSKAFAQAVCYEALRGSLLLRDAGRLLNVPPGKVKKFAEFC